MPSTDKSSFNQEISRRNNSRAPCALIYYFVKWTSLSHCSFSGQSDHHHLPSAQKEWTPSIFSMQHHYEQAIIFMGQIIWFQKKTVTCLCGLSKNNCTEDEHSICGSKNYVFYDVIASKKSNFSWLVRRTVPGKLWIFAKMTDLANFLNSIYMRNNLLLLVCTR